MRIYCEQQESHPDAYCHFCGQGFAVHFDGETPREQAEALRQVDLALRLHHLRRGGQGVHPGEGFQVRTLPEVHGFEASSETMALCAA